MIFLIITIQIMKPLLFKNYYKNALQRFGFFLPSHATDTDIWLISLNFILIFLIYFLKESMIGNFTQSLEFKAEPKVYNTKQEKLTNVQERLLEYVLTNTQKGNPLSCIEAIDKFCSHYWMMNLGDEKAKIIIYHLKQMKPMKILQIGSYCGYSSLVLAYYSPPESQIYCIEVNQYFANIAKKIHEHAGVSKKIHFHIGTTQQNQNFLQNFGAFDFIFIDHVKNYYLSDFKIIAEAGGVAKGTIIVGDNIIYPGAPDYLNYFRQKVVDQYKSVLYHSYLEYSNDPDAVLVSEKL